jgi:hypothetical protein
VPPARRVFQSFVGGVNGEDLDLDLVESVCGRVHGDDPLVAYLNIRYLQPENTFTGTAALAENRRSFEILVV